MGDIITFLYTFQKAFSLMGVSEMKQRKPEQNVLAFF